MTKDRSTTTDSPRDAGPVTGIRSTRQRAAIAVALYHDPDIILADEPTASLDTRRAQDVAHLLANQTHELGKATVMVTHDERLLPVCDRVLAMHDGVLTEQDAPKDSERQSGSRDDR